MTYVQAQWPGARPDQAPPTITPRLDNYGQLHVRFPENVTHSVGKDDLDAFVAEWVATGRQMQALIGVDDEGLRTLAAAVIAEQEDLNTADVLRIVGAHANYMAHPPTDEERELLSAGLEVAE
jgi:hypothetical protein